MTKQTEKYITGMLAADDTIPQSVGKKALAILSGKAAPEVGQAADELKTRSEAAKMLRVCPVTVTNWGKRGIIRAVRINGRRKAVGYSLNSINAFLSGAAASEEVR